jgi:hypothetical protein
MSKTLKFYPAMPGGVYRAGEPLPLGEPIELEVSERRYKELMPDDTTTETERVCADDRAVDPVRDPAGV